MSTLTDWRVVIARVRELAADITGSDLATITKRTDLVDDLGMDAKQAAQLRRALQDEFEIEIPKADAKQLTTVGDLIRYVEARAR